MLNPDLEKHTFALSSYLPNGKMFEAKNIRGSNLRQLLRGLSGELFRAQGYLVTLEDEYFPDATTLFLDEWERALGIPDSCFSGTGTADERRRDIVTKLSALGIQTVEDFEALAVVFGVTAVVLAGKDSAVSFATEREARYTIVVALTLPERFPYTFPFTFGDNLTALLECLFLKLKPANCQVIFQGV